MGNKNYTKYSEKSENNVEENIKDVQLELPVETEVETKTETEVETKTETEVETEALPVGIVTGCVKLNVRKEPSKDSEIVCVLEEFHEVTLDMASPETYEDFYKIYTSVNDVLVEGYCMKQFINIK